MLLHGEQFIELMQPEGRPVQGSLACETRIVAVDEKVGGRGTVVVAQVTCKDAASGRVLAIAEGSTFNRGARAQRSFGGTADRRQLAMEPIRAALPQQPPQTTPRQRVADSSAAFYLTLLTI